MYNLKHLLIILTCLVVTKTVASQCDNSLIGKWKVVAVLNGGTYFNLKTDSIHFSPLMAFRYTTDSSKKEFLLIQKEMYKDALFDFQNDSSLNIRMMGDNIKNIRYCFKKTDSKLEITSKGSSGENLTDARPAIIKNGLLYLTISPDEMEEYRLEMILEKSVEH